MAWVKTRGIVLHVLPYNDKYVIIYMYTEAFGRVSYLVARSRSKKSLQTKGLFMPLAVLELEVDQQPKRDLHRIRESKLCFPINQLSGHPIKSMIALFLAEVLFRTVKETEPDGPLFDYLSRSVRLLEELEAGLANFHLVFLMGLLHYLGIFPNVESHRDNEFFDLQEGRFVNQLPLHPHYLNQAESQVFVRLLKISYENMSLYAFSRHDRGQILHQILHYYRLHLPDFPEIKSLAILQSLFD
ncbi:MAG: DNA repair protein RecO [Parabacteroides sp.]